MQQYDVLIIGAGAAGLMCAAVAGARGRKVLLIDHARAPGEKIRISGGGRCNFTNVHASPKNFLSANRHFHKSALARYTPADFLALVERHGIAWHEKTLGQLFCDDTARQIVNMLLDECRAGGVELRLSTSAGEIERRETGFSVRIGEGEVEVSSLVIATGGKSIPKMGATGFAYEVAERFGLPLVEQRAGLVPFTLDPATLELLAPLAGIAVPAEINCGKTCFREALLFTHRGLSGPAVLQISSYWRPGDEIRIRLLPEVALAERLAEAKRATPRQSAANLLAGFLPKKLAQFFVEQAGLGGGAAGDLPDKALRALAARIQDWRLKPSGTEGYRTAEVTLGGVDTSALSSQTMEAREVPGLYFIGECVDVTGWLGGYNFQWAWASAQAAGQTV